jgi:transcriptional regulator with XRE-family HTH domain
MDKKSRSLIEELHRYRLEHELTQRELAKRLKVTVSTINYWLKARTEPQPIHRYRIEKLLAKRSS